MVKTLLYNDKIFLNARRFYEFVLINTFDGEEPTNWNLEYVAVCWTAKLKTFSGIKVDWVSVEDTIYDQLKASPDGWLKWTLGGDKTFLNFIKDIGEDYTKEDLWRWAVEYVTTYDLPRSKMKRLVDDIMDISEVVGKSKNVQVYQLIKNIKDKEPEVLYKL